jgi:hypothetical protein
MPRLTFSKRPRKRRRMIPSQEGKELMASMDLDVENASCSLSGVCNNCDKHRKGKSVYAEPSNCAVDEILQPQSIWYCALHLPSNG